MPVLAEIPGIKEGALVGSVITQRVERNTIYGTVPLRDLITKPGTTAAIDVYRVRRIGGVDSSGVARPHVVEVVFSTNPAHSKGTVHRIGSGYRRFTSLDPEAPDEVMHGLKEGGIQIYTRPTKSGETSVRVERHDPIGRRFYINEGALGDLAAQSTESAELIYDSLMRVSTTKTAYTQLRDAITYLGFPEKDFLKILNFLDRNSKVRLTSMFRQIGYRPTDPKQYNDFLPVLGDEEEVVASCYDQKIKSLTFATGIQASHDMFDDIGAIQTAPDLTIIKRGKKNQMTLAYIDPEKGTGDGKAKEYFSGPKKKAVLTDVEVDAIKDSVRNKVLIETAKILVDSYPWDPENAIHRKVLNNLFSAYFNSLHSSLFKNQSEIADPKMRDEAKKVMVENLTNFIFDKQRPGKRKKQGVLIPNI